MSENAVLSRTKAEGVKDGRMAGCEIARLPGAQAAVPAAERQEEVGGGEGDVLPATASTTATALQQEDSADCRRRVPTRCRWLAAPAAPDTPLRAARVPGLAHRDAVKATEAVGGIAEEALQRVIAVETKARGSDAAAVEFEMKKVDKTEFEGKFKNTTAQLVRRSP
jgi:hypothetical protein